MKKNILRIAIVDDDKHCVRTLASVVTDAGFEPVPINVENKTTISDVLAKIGNSKVVLLDHQMHRFSGEDVAKKLPPEVLVITTSDHERTDAYCKHRLPGKKSHSFPRVEMVNIIKEKVRAIS